MCLEQIDPLEQERDDLFVDWTQITDNPPFSVKTLRTQTIYSLAGTCSGFPLLYRDFAAYPDPEIGSWVIGPVPPWETPFSDRNGMEDPGDELGWVFDVL